MQPPTTSAPTLEEIWRLFQETDRKMQETDRQLKETGLQLKETDRIVKEWQRENALAIKAVTTSIGKLGNRLGEFVEEAVRPSAARLFQQCGIDVHEVQQNIVVNRNGESLELDLLVVNDKDVVAIECKSHLSTDDVNDHLSRLAKLKQMLPRYQDSRILGAVAGMVVPDNVASYAIRKGLYVIGQNGGHLELRNQTAFTPATW
jgi:hypothetical protein